MHELIDLKNRVNQLFDELMARTQPGETNNIPGEWTPRVDVYELGDRVMLRADLPGVAAEDLEIRLEGGQLLLRGSRRQPQDTDPSTICRLERPFGSFVRRYALPDSIDPETVRAALLNGVLEIVLGKRETASIRRIPVRMD